jgi:hypothetical protein
MFIFTLLILTVVGLLIAWSVITNQHYTTCKLAPGDVYTVDGQEYAMPNIPIVKGQARLLKEKFMMKMRKLLTVSTGMLDEMDIEYWLSGGTLLGFERHDTFEPWDDDIDVHVMLKHRDRMFTVAFAQECEKYGLEAIYFMGASSTMATKEGSAVRLRALGQTTPVMDVFFEGEVDTDSSRIAKIDTWYNGHNTFSTKEEWPKDWIFPLETRQIDGFSLKFPKEAIKCLKRQYGDNVMNEIIARPPIIAHNVVYELLSFVWRKKT